MILKWFDTKEVDALAKRMVDDMVKRIPATNFGSGGRKREAKKDRTHDLVLRQASEFARDHKLNVYTKARLANNFKWALLDAGYPLLGLKGVPLLARTAGLIAHLVEEQQRAIGFVMSHAAAQAIDYDGEAPPGFKPGEEG